MKVTVGFRSSLDASGYPQATATLFLDPLSDPEAYRNMTFANASKVAFAVIKKKLGGGSDFFPLAVELEDCDIRAMQE